MASNIKDDLEFHFSVRDEQVARATGAAIVTLLAHQVAAPVFGPKWAHRLSHTLMTTGLLSATWTPATSSKPKDAMQVFREFRARPANTHYPAALVYTVWGLEIAGTMFGQVSRVYDRVRDKIVNSVTAPTEK